MQEKTFFSGTFFVFYISIVILIFSGCMPKVTVVPVTDYPRIEKYDLRIGLEMTQTMCTANWNLSYDGSSVLEYPLGDDFCLNAEKLAKALFTSVYTFDKSSNKSIDSVDAVLTPKIVTLIVNTPSEEQTTTLIVEWSLKNNQGDIIWIDTITAQGKANRSKLQEQVQAVFEDLFHKSFEAISSSVEIKRFTEPNL